MHIRSEQQAIVEPVLAALGDGADVRCLENRRDVRSGDRALLVVRPEAVEDLRQRSATYRAKLVPTTRTSRSGTLAPVHVEMETLNCVTCGCDFRRTRVRGRKPMHCPQCGKE